MVYINIGLYGEKSQDRAFCSHSHNAKENLNTYKKFSIIINNIKYVISISVHACFSIDNDSLGHAIKIKAHGIIDTYKWAMPT